MKTKLLTKANTGVVSFSSQKEIKDILSALETANSILGNIAEQCPSKIRRNKVVKLNVGGGQRWWKHRADMMEVLLGKVRPYRISERHKYVLLSGIEIDKGVAPLIKALWKVTVRTYECCQGGYDGEEGSKHNRGFVILHAKDYDKARAVLKKFVGRFTVEKGTGGYCPSEYNDNVTKDDTFVYVSWKAK